MVDFAAATFPRILHTIESGELIAKPEALTLLAGRFPAWHPLVIDAWSREGRRLGRLRGMRIALRMVREIRKSAGNTPMS